MKILVFSDSHDVLSYMYSAIDAEKPDMVLHLGDHDRDAEDIPLMYPDITVRTVRGNCDRGSQGLDIDEFVIENKRFIMTHGHLFGVKLSLSKLRDYAEAHNADIVLFGHTHRSLCETWIDKRTYVNPGSICSGSSYAEITITDGNVTCELKR